MRRLKRSKSVSTAGVVAAALLFLAVTPLPAQAAVPTTTQVWPPNPAPGCVVSLTGTNYLTVANGGPASLVQFGAQPAAAPVAIDADSQLEATVPAALGPSAATTVTVTNVSGSSAAFPFTTGPAVPTCPGTPTPTPSIGAVGSTVQLLGAFNAVPFLVRFNNINATITGVPTSTLVTVVVPAGAPAVSTIRVYTTAGVASAPFTVTTTGPTITGFTPASGPVGTSVTINGTNLTGATSVTFNNVAAAAGWVVNGTGTQITGAIVPSTATDGLIRVITPGGTAVSPTNFDVTGPDGEGHPRSVSLQLNKSSGSLKASGDVGATDGFADCEANVGVKIQQQKSGGWNTLTTLQTNSSGSYKGYVPAKSGKYRAKAAKITLLSGAVCAGDTSPTRNYNA